jgi:D-arginine dehydrogenase
MTSAYEVAVIGAGLIGASAAYHLAQHRSTILIEQEPQPGYHSSGRSAAVLLPPYGGPLARALTRSGVDFLLRPPVSFGYPTFTAPRGALFLAGARQLSLLDRWQPQDGSAADGSSRRMLSAQQALERVPILLAEQIAAALWLPEVLDIDTGALLQGFLRTYGKLGGVIQLNAQVAAISREHGLWRVETPASVIRAKTIVNAAGAWADQIAELAGAARMNLVPTRRTMVLVDPPAGVDIREWPLVCDVAETLYFKPDAGRLVVSPADHAPVVAGDVQPEEWDIAVAVDRLEATTSLRVGRIAHKWAGLRTMTPDGEPIIGFDPRRENFVWAAGFGGFGVQAAFAAGKCCEVLVCGDSLPSEFAHAGVDLGQLSPGRLSATTHN